MKAFSSCTLATVSGLAAVASAASAPRVLSLRSLAARDVTDADRCTVAADIGGAFGGNCGVYKFCNDLFTGNVAFDPNFGFMANDASIANDGFLGNIGAEVQPDAYANDGYHANDASWAGLDPVIQDLLDSESNDGYLDGVMSGWYGFLGNIGFANSGFDSVYDGFVSYNPVTGVSIDANAIADDTGALLTEGVLKWYSAICLALQDCGEFSSSGSFSQCGSPSACKEDWIGDGQCDEECNTLEFFFDGGDCSALAQSVLSAAASETANTPSDVYGCQSRQGDGVCDMLCNTAEFNNDGGDCVTSNLDNLGSEVGQALLGGVDAVGSAVADAANVAGEVAGGVVNTADQALNQAANVAGQVAGVLGDAAGQALTEAGQVAGAVAGQVEDAASQALTEADNAVGQVAGQAVDAVGQAVNTATDTVTNALGNAGEAIGNLFG